MPYRDVDLLLSPDGHIGRVPGSVWVWVWTMMQICTFRVDQVLPLDADPARGRRGHARRFNQCHCVLRWNAQRWGGPEVEARLIRKSAMGTGQSMAEVGLEACRGDRADAPGTLCRISGEVRARVRVRARAGEVTSRKGPQIGERVRRVEDGGNLCPGICVCECRKGHPLPLLGQES